MLAKITAAIGLERDAPAEPDNMLALAGCRRDKHEGQAVRRERIKTRCCSPAKEARDVFNCSISQLSQVFCYLLSRGVSKWIQQAVVSLG